MSIRKHRTTSWLPEKFNPATAVSKNQNTKNPWRLTSIRIGLLLVASLSTTTNAFAVIPTRLAGTCYQSSSRSLVLDMAADENEGPNHTDDDGEDDCGDEGCEIDWDTLEWDDFEDEDDEVEAVFYPPKQATVPTVEQRRLHMEMQWQLTEAQDECVVEEPETCGSDKCQDCNGRGWNDCRFCHGTAVLRMDKKFVMPEAEEPTTTATALSVGTSATTTRKKFILPASFSACKICSQGVEMCRTCQGSGWVAGWTQIPNAGRDDPLLP